MTKQHDSDKQSFQVVEEKDLAEIRHSEQSISETRRAFILKYGALAAITPVALTLTLHSQKALASSCTECGP